MTSERRAEILKRRNITNDECMEVFKRYDGDLYDHYKSNFWFFGYNARNYAMYVLRQHPEFAGQTAEPPAHE